MLEWVKWQISITVTSSPASVFKSLQNFTFCSHSPVHPLWFPCASRGNAILRTTKCALCGLSYSRRLGSATLPQPQGTSYKPFAETERHCTGRLATVAQLQILLSPGLVTFSFLLQKTFVTWESHTIICTAGIKWYQSRTESKSLPIAILLREEAVRESLAIRQFTLLPKFFLLEICW